jgi:hypothetical protein
MNERIKEIVELAHSHAYELAQQPDYNEHNPYNFAMYKQQYDTKFAELIVKECIGRVKLLADFDENTEAWVYEQVMNDIKEHFGVKE